MEGQVLGGRYQLVRQLGEGGMGQVWEARDGRLGRHVAVKVIALLGGGGSRGDEARARFLREAQITAALQHPNIVTLHDLGEADIEGGRTPFLVMELLRGDGLDAVLRRGPVELSEAARWGAQIGDALTAAHDAGVLHRDIKPSNVLVTPSGVVKVLDFGIARAADSPAAASHLTRTGFIVGTPPYMAPEQARGLPERRSDLYALGCLLFELITGRLVFQAPDAVGYLTAHLTQEPPPPSSLAAHIPPAWDEVVLTLLRKEPERRYGTASELAEALRRLELGRVATTLTETAAPQKPSEQRRGAPAAAQAFRRLEEARAASGPTELGTRSPSPAGSFEARPALPQASRPAEVSPQPRTVPSVPVVHSNPKPLGWWLRGFGGRVLGGAVVLGLLVLVHHTINPNGSWGLARPAVLAFVLVLALCAWGQHRATWDKLIIDRHALRVTLKDGKGENKPFVIPWASLDRISVSEGSSGKVVVWYRPDIPAPHWVTNRNVERYPDGSGYIVYRLTSRTGGLHVPDAKLAQFRKALIRWAGPKYVTLPFTRRR